MEIIILALLVAGGIVLPIAFGFVLPGAGGHKAHQPRTTV